MYLKDDMVTAIARIANITKKDAEMVFMAYNEALEEGISMAGGCKITGYYTIEVTRLKPRKIVNKNIEGGTCDAPARNKLRLKPGVLLQEAADSWSE